MQTLAYDHVFQSDSPILVVTPHTGSVIPGELLEYPAWVQIAGRLADPAGMKLQQAAISRGVSCISGVFHPCAINLNITTDVDELPKHLLHEALCRTRTNRGEALYPAGSEPTETEVRRRVSMYWRPFHAALVSEILRLRRRHEHILLLVSHVSSWLSPYSVLPGTTDWNVVTNNGHSCDKRFVCALTESVKTHGYSWVVNGATSDAFAARHYGFPAHGIHAMEVEIAGRSRIELDRGVRTGQGWDDFTMSTLIDDLLDVMPLLPRANGISEAAFIGSKLRTITI